MGMLYTVLRGAIRAFSPDMTTEWAQPFDGAPSVFCPNHAGVFGPIDICAHFPLRDQCHPWYNAGMATPKEVPAYVRQDYWWRPGCKLEPLYNATLPYLAAVLIPPILKSTPGVPVYHDARVLKTFRQSVEHLRAGEHLVIFPQQPSGYKSHHMWINKGFLQIAPMAYRSLGLALKFYPVHIDHQKRRISVGEPVAFDPNVKLKDQEQRLLSGIAAGI